MEAKSQERYIRMPTRKLRRIINEVRGKSVTEAMNMLKFMPYFAAKVVAKNIKSAAANAAEKWGVDSSQLIVSEAMADEGPTYKRAKPRAQGRIYRIEKRTSHLSVTVRVSEELKEKLEKKKAALKAKKAPAKKAKKVESKAEVLEAKPVEEVAQVKEEVQQEEIKQEAEEQVVEEKSHPEQSEGSQEIKAEAEQDSSAAPQNDDNEESKQEE